MVWTLKFWKGASEQSLSRKRVIDASRDSVWLYVKVYVLKAIYLIRLEVNFLMDSREDKVQAWNL